MAKAWLYRTEAVIKAAGKKDVHVVTEFPTELDFIAAQRCYHEFCLKGLDYRAQNPHHDAHSAKGGCPHGESSITIDTEYSGGPKPKHMKGLDTCFDLPNAAHKHGEGLLKQFLADPRIAKFVVP